MILGLERPSSGTATIEGRPIDSLPDPMRVVGALLDAGAIHPQRTAADHLLAVARVGDIPEARVHEVLDLVGLAHAAQRPAGQFSLGMKQRLGIATALLGDPDILIFDEPLNGLDPEGIRWARTLMRDLAAEGRTVLFSSHLMGEMELTADRLVVINHGHLLADQTVTEFIDEHTTTSTLVRTPDRDTLTQALRDTGLDPQPHGADGLRVTRTTTDAVGRIAAHAGIGLLELTHHRDGLEDAFLRLTQNHTANTNTRPSPQKQSSEEDA
ncbi:MAG: ATP-binding cassette domain-containing protein [Acidipropionibacterium sp.]|nr:ATP-binding cassette domain-containing protein [Acidipropionibacterium sp.]